MARQEVSLSNLLVVGTGSSGSWKEAKELSGLTTSPTLAVKRIKGATTRINHSSVPCHYYIFVL